MQVIKSLYGRHFQKSKVFLYPALGIGRKDVVTPVATYISWDGHYKKEDQVLICLYMKDHVSYVNPHTREREYKNNPGKYNMFANKYLDGHRLFHRRHEMDYPDVVYVFRFPDKKDWECFLEGKYSKFSKDLKGKIRQYFAQSNEHYAYMDSYINPEMYYGMYSDILGVHVNLLKEVVELCECPNLENETLKLTLKQKQSV